MVITSLLFSVIIRLLLPFILIFIDLILFKPKMRVGKFKKKIYLFIDILGLFVYLILICFITSLNSTVSDTTEDLGKYALVVLQASGYDLPVSIELENDVGFNYTKDDLTSIGAIDINQVDFSKVNLSTNDFQAGSNLVRYQLYLITKEICDRPEISITQSELLGILYTEDFDEIKNATDLINAKWPGTNNSSNCGGPFQISDTLLYDEDENHPEAVRAYVSKLENPLLLDDQRAMTRLQAKQYTERFKFNPTNRPDKFYFSDAAYTAAYRLSKNAEGYHYGRTPSNIFGQFKDAFNLIDNLSLSSDNKFLIKYVTAMQNYSGLIIDCCLGWNLDLYINILKTKGSLNYKWQEAYNKRNLNKELFNDTNKVSQNDGSLVSTLIPSSQFNLTSYVDEWNKYYRGTNHFPTHIYPFISLNGGEWIYQGLKTFVQQLSTKSEFNIDNSLINNTQFSLTKDKDGSIYTNHISSNLIGECTGNVPSGNYQLFQKSGVSWLCPLPLSTYTITSLAQDERTLEGKTSSHNGTDLALLGYSDGGYGYPVVSTRDGIVVSCMFNSSTSEYGENAGGGLFVKIQHDDGTLAIYMHLSRTIVAKGQQVKAGEKIGEVGNTGYCVPGPTAEHPYYGTHLHFELRNSSNQSTAELRQLSNDICKVN